MREPVRSVRALATGVLRQARARGLTVATAESCTGGLLAGALTAIAGSSDIFDRGFVTYSNEAKTAMLGVAEKSLAAHGAVSAQVATEMALGTLKHSRADVTVAITGIAGPGGGSHLKPVGLVYIAAASRDGLVSVAEHRFGPRRRAQVRDQTVRAALEHLLAIMEGIALKTA